LQVAAGYLPIRDQDVQPAALFTLPLGVFLAQGISISVDSAPAIRFPYEQCTNVGCSAILPLDSKMLSQFKKGNKADIIVDEGARLLVIELSLSGFTAGFKRVATTQK
jgi:invasion protein IalB